MVFWGVGGKCSSQHEITFIKLYCLFYLIKLTKFLNARYLPAVLNTQGTPLHWKHLNNRRLEGIQYDFKEKLEYNLKDFRPERRKLPNASNMLYIE